MKDQNVFKLIKLLIRLLGIFPRPVLLFFSDAIALIWYAVDTRHRNLVIQNIQLAYPDQMTAAAAAAFAKKNFRHTASILFEVIWSYSQPSEKLFKHFVIKGLEHVDAARKKGRGIMVVSCHMGIFELVIPAVASVDIRLHILYRQLDYPPLEWLMLELRQRFGITMVPLRGASSKIARILEENGIVATLLDQNVDWYKGVFVDFFGRPACTNSGLAKLVIKSRPVVLPAFITKKNDQYHLEVLPEIPVTITGDPIKDIENNTQAYVSAIESMVRQCPEQYFWVHNRWKTKPFCELDKR